LGRIDQFVSSLRHERVVVLLPFSLQHELSFLFDYTVFDSHVESNWIRDLPFPLQTEGHLGLLFKDNSASDLLGFFRVLFLVNEEDSRFEGRVTTVAAVSHLSVAVLGTPSPFRLKLKSFLFRVSVCITLLIGFEASLGLDGELFARAFHGATASLNHLSSAEGER